MKILRMLNIYIGDDLQPTREPDAGQREARGGLCIIIIKQLLQCGNINKFLH